MSCFLSKEQGRDFFSIGVTLRPKNRPKDFFSIGVTLHPKNRAKDFFSIGFALHPKNRAKEDPYSPLRGGILFLHDLIGRS